MHAHAHTYAQTHACTLTCTRARTYTHTHTHAQIQRDRHTHRHTQTRTQRQRQRQRQRLRPRQAHTPTHTHTRTCMMCIYMYVCARVCFHTRASCNILYVYTHNMIRTRKNIYKHRQTDRLIDWFIHIWHLNTTASMTTRPRNTTLLGRLSNKCRVVPCCWTQAHTNNEITSLMDQRKYM